MLKTFIWGGCTSRDAVDLGYEQHGLELLRYVARQSLISAFAPADPGEFVIDPDAGNFQRRILTGDIRGSIPEELRRRADEIDLIVWDLMIERVGVARVESGGMVTRNGVLKAEGTAPLGRGYRFGSLGHIRLWMRALTQFTELLDSLGLTEKIVLNATPWAVIDANGEFPRSDTKMRPELFNRQIARYWRLAERAGISVARVPQEEVVADPDHKWGPAYFHYVPKTYEAQLDAIDAIRRGRS